MGDQASGLLSPWLRTRRIRAALPYVSGPTLDIGCGIGVLATHLPAAVPYFGQDLDPASIETARARHGGGQRTFSVDWPPAQRRFETVVSLAVIEHVADPVTLVRAMTERLLPSGRIVLTTPHPRLEWAHDLGSRLGLFSRHAEQEHEQLLDRGALAALAAECGLALTLYRPFLLGANQLAVLAPA